MFAREDWTLFRSLETLQQKAGVSATDLTKLVVKELADNALDASGGAMVGLLRGNGFYVEDLGDGIPGDDQEVADLFSVNRPLTSSKLLRLPTRGALGNGLRVVTGAVMATAGKLRVGTKGRILRLIPDGMTGRTGFEVIGPSRSKGTRVEVQFGPGLSVDRDALSWAERTIGFAGGEKTYEGRTSPFWYDSDSFFELMNSTVSGSVAEVIGQFKGCAHPKSGRIAAEFAKRAARDLSYEEADRLLGLARQHARPVNPECLGSVGPSRPHTDGYAKLAGFFPIHSGRGIHRAELPFVMEAWVRIDSSSIPSDTFGVYVNRTHITTEVNAYHDAKKRTLSVFGCGLRHAIRDVGRRPMTVTLNIGTPFMPITGDGKTPDLGPLIGDIAKVTKKAIGKARNSVRSRPENRTDTQRAVILGRLEEAIAKAGSDGTYRFSLRQLFYAVRPYVIESCGKEPEYGYFGQVITDYENAQGRDIPRMYRDSRGTLYHPHTGDDIPLGTISVEGYHRPAWTFNKVLYCEKEGFFPILKDAGWPERHDCALMTSKGFATRAARDVLDLLGETDEELTFYCIHDADAAGTVIYQALQEGTQARPGRKVRIVNLGLEPDEALEMGLQVEEVTRDGDKVAPVASYVSPERSEWLQTKRVELNAMTTPQFLAWLDRKFEGNDDKVIPPDQVAVARLEADVRSQLDRQIAARVLSEARVDDQVEEAFQDRLHRIADVVPTLREDVRRSLDEDRASHWTAPIEVLARTIAED